MISSGPPLRRVVIGRTVADRFPDQIGALTRLEEHFLVDEGADTVIRIIEGAQKADSVSVQYYGGLEEGRQFMLLAKTALIPVEIHLAAGPDFLGQLGKILALAGIEERAVATGLEEFARYLSAVPVGA